VAGTGTRGMGIGAMSTGGMGIEVMGIGAMGTEGGIGLDGRESSSAPVSSCPLGPTGDHFGSRMTTHLWSSRHPRRSLFNPHRRSGRLPSTGTIAMLPKPTTRMSTSAQGDGGR
jgi:hypothetical protein